MANPYDEHDQAMTPLQSSQAETNPNHKHEAYYVPATSAWPIVGAVALFFDCARCRFNRWWTHGWAGTLGVAGRCWSLTHHADGVV